MACKIGTHRSSNCPSVAPHFGSFDRLCTQQKLAQIALYKTTKVGSTGRRDKELLCKRGAFKKIPPLSGGGGGIGGAGRM